MKCILNLQLTNYDVDTGKKKTFNVPLGPVEENQQLTVDEIAQMIASLSQEERSNLAVQLRAAKLQTITNTTIKRDPKNNVRRYLVSNITLQDLRTQYPDLDKYGIPLDLQYNFTLIKCSQATFNGTAYKGRTVDADGNEIFIINSFWDADKLFRHLSAKLNLSKFIQGNHVDEFLGEYAEDLATIANRHHKTIQQLIEDYLINKNAYNTFKQGNRLYSPKRIISQVLNKVLGEVYDVGDKSDLQLELEAIKESSSTSNEWVLDKKRLYDVLSIFNQEFAETYSYEQFKELSEDTLNDVLKNIFVSDVKLMRASVMSTTRGEKIIKDSKDEKKTIRILSEQIQAIYETNIKPYLEANIEDFSEFKSTKDGKAKIPNRYQDVTKKLGYKFNDIITKLGPFSITLENGENVELIFGMDNKYKLTASYETVAPPKVTEKRSYIKLDMHNWSTLGETYDPSYNTESWYEHVEEYKGFYIYALYRNGHTHYAISRSIIHPKAYVKTFSSLEVARAAIDSNKDTLKSCGLWSIKQQTGRPRETKIEMDDLREGQIITTLDLALPRIDQDRFHTDAKNLMDDTIENFQAKLAFVPNIQTLNTPEKATAFLFLIHDKLNKLDDFFSFIRKNNKEVQECIDLINSVPKIHYLVESKSYGSGSNAKYLVKLLQKDGVNIDLYSTRPDLATQDFIMQSLGEAIEHIEEVYGISVNTLSLDELKDFSMEKGLGIEDKLHTIKAFVYDGEIYINASAADTSDLFHELSHILLGVIKAHNPEVYQDIINKFSSTNRFKFLFNSKTRTYKHYTQADIIEETVADMIAEEISKQKKLGTSELSGSEIMSLFEDIFKRSQRFTQTLPDNGIGFGKYMATLLNNHSDTMRRNMQISNLVKQYIEDEKIKEICQ